MSITEEKTEPVKIYNDDIEQAFINCLTNVERTWHNVSNSSGNDKLVNAHLRGMMNGLSMLKSEINILSDSRNPTEQATGVR